MLSKTEDGACIRFIPAVDRKQRKQLLVGCCCFCCCCFFWGEAKVTFVEGRESVLSSETVKGWVWKVGPMSTGMAARRTADSALVQWGSE